MGTLWYDVRHGARMLVKKPGFTAVAIAALALGIGANTAIFSVVYGVMLRPLPFAEAGRLVGMRETLPDEGSIPLAYRTFAEWRDRNNVFDSIAAMTAWQINLESGEEPTRVEGMAVSASYFDVMGVRPLVGRGFIPEEDRPGAERVVVIGHDLWRGRFGSDPEIIGRSLRISGRDFRVVGVMPQAIDSAAAGWASIWRPLAIDDQKGRPNRGRYLHANARLKPGVTHAEARADLERLMTLIKQDFPETHNSNYGVDLRPLNDFIVPAGTQRALLVLLVAVGLVLLIACANVANLTLARAAAREREIAVRAALGATRARLVRQLLTESALLALAGAAGGLLLASYGTDLLVALDPSSVPRIGEVGLHLPVLLFTLGISLLTVLAFGLAPSLRATRPDLNAALKEGARSSVAGRSRLRSALVVAEVALSLVLLTGAGLMLKSFARLSAVEAGFDLDNVLTMELNLPWATYPEGGQRIQFYRQAVERISQLPGVEVVSAAQSLPLRDILYTDPVFIEGRPVPPRGEEPVIRQNIVTDDYFRSMGMRLARGRHFTEQESWETGGAVIINEAFARRFFHGEDPLGRRLQAGYNTPWVTVVGIIPDSVQDGIGWPTIEEMFYPYVNPTAPPLVRMNLVVRTTTDPAGLVAAVREEIRALDRGLPLTNVFTMRQLADRSLRGERLNLMLMNLFACVALALALTGIYGVMSYATSQRTHEIGVRMALGAQERDVLRLVVGEGMTMALAGVGAGLLASLALTRFLRSLLFEVSPTDATTFAAVALLLSAAALLACLIPARRAAKVDPMVALRYE